MSATSTQLRELANAIDGLAAPPGTTRRHAAEEVLRLVGSVPELSAELTTLRTIAALELRSAGWKVSRIAELAGVTRSAMAQLVGPAELEEAGA